MPHSVIRSSHFVADEENTVVAGIRLVLSHRGAGSRPGHDSRLHAHGLARRRKREVWRAAANVILAIGNVVKHVALTGMRLAPGEFMRRNVGSFGKIGCALILCCVEVASLYTDPV